MAKAKLKKEGETIPEGMKIIDLSPEKRSELYQTALRKFDEESVKIYGISVGVELAFSPQGIKPKMVLVDTLRKADGQKTTSDTAAPTK